MSKRKPIKILFLHHFPLWGCGSGTYVRNLASQLVKKERVAIVCPEQRTIPNIKIYPVRLPFFVAFTGHPEHPGCRLYSQLTSSEITKIYKTFLHYSVDAVENFRPHIIHVQHVSLLSWVARFIYAIYGIPYIITCHGTDLHNVSLDKRYEHLTYDALKAARKITCVSGDTREWLYEIFNKEKIHHKTRTIPGGIDLSKYSEPENNKNIDDKYGIGGKPMILFTGKLTPFKGVRYLVKASRYILGEIFIIGDGPEKKTLEDLARDLKLKNIHFVGYFGKEDRKEFHQLYNRADVFVAPSVWDEPLGMVILEAMAYETPVVVTRKGGIPLAVKDGVNGYFVRPRNSRDIAEKVNKIISNPELKKQMGANARKIVAEKFTWEKIAKRFVSIYQSYAIKNNEKK